MLKLGQDVIIYDTPAYGDEYFDEDYIYERATICGITTINDELAYQLEGYDEDSWWVEDELDDEYEYDQELKTPTYDLGDEVVDKNFPYEKRRITGIFLVNDEVVYQLEGSDTWFEEIKEKEMTVRHKSYKFRLYPNQEQKQLFAKTFGCRSKRGQLFCRWARI